MAELRCDLSKYPTTTPCSGLRIDHLFLPAQACDVVLLLSSRQDLLYRGRSYTTQLVPHSHSHGDLLCLDMTSPLIHLKRMPYSPTAEYSLGKAQLACDPAVLHDGSPRFDLQSPSHAFSSATDQALRTRSGPATLDLVGLLHGIVCQHPRDLGMCRFWQSSATQVDIRLPIAINGRKSLPRQSSIEELLVVPDCTKLWTSYTSRLVRRPRTRSGEEFSPPCIKWRCTIF